MIKEYDFVYETKQGDIAYFKNGQIVKAIFWLTGTPIAKVPQGKWTVYVEPLESPLVLSVGGYFVGPLDYDRNFLTILTQHYQVHREDGHALVNDQETKYYSHGRMVDAFTFWYCQNLKISSL